MDEYAAADILFFISLQNVRKGIFFYLNIMVLHFFQNKL
jgi:hypothetical protein